MNNLCCRTGDFKRGAAHGFFGAGSQGMGKKKKKLYDTSLSVASPVLLKDVEKPIVILKAGTYTDEIINDILTGINGNTEFSGMMRGIWNACEKRTIYRYFKNHCMYHGGF